MSKEAMKQALKALLITAYSDNSELVAEAIQGLEAALAAPTQKPVASIYIHPNGAREVDDWRCDLPAGRTELYTGPTGSPLTDKQAEKLFDASGGGFILCLRDAFDAGVRRAEKYHGI